MNLMDDSLWGQTVTLYRQMPDGICRQVVEKAYLHRKDSRKLTACGAERTKVFTLILPFDSDIACGDRVWEGIGPKAESWNTFLPASYGELMEVNYVQKYHWDGRVCHVQAGCR